MKPLEVAALSGLVLVLLTLALTQSMHRMFWGDEIMGMLVLRQTSVHALLHFWRQGIDSSGIFFYVFAKPWMLVFGSHPEVALRFYSAMAVAISACLIWRTARRFYPPLPAFISLAIVYLVSFSLRWQLSNGRTYGLLMAAAALVIFCALRPDEQSNSRPRAAFLLAIFLSYALLTGSHLLGFLYALLFLSVQIAIDLLCRRPRPLVYLAALASILAVGSFNLPNIRSTLNVGKPSFWTLRPTMRQFLHSDIIFDPQVAALITLCFTFAVLCFVYRRARVPVYVLLGGYLVLDLVLFVVSRISTSIYVDRYLLPFSFAAVLLFCEFFTQVGESEGRYKTLRTYSPLLFLLLALPSIPHRRLDWYPVPDYTRGLVASLPAGVPVVDTDVASFVEVQFYHPVDMGGRLLFPTDWEVALDPNNHGGVSGFHEIDNLKSLGVYADSIQPTADILRANPHFLVLTSPEPTAWFQRRVVESGHYNVVDRGHVPGDLHLWDVTVR